MTLQEVKLLQKKQDYKIKNLVIEKQTENYAAQEKRYAAGQLNTHDLLDYRFRLALAELEHIKALIDYNIAFIELEKARGLTLVKNDITLEEQEKKNEK